MRKNAFDYLNIEHCRLFAEYQALQAEFRALTSGKRPEFRTKLRAYRAQLANHRLARRWARPGGLPAN